MTNKEKGSLAFKGFETVLHSNLTEETFVKSMLSKAFRFEPIKKGVHGFSGRMRFNENDKGILKILLLFRNSELQFSFISPDCSNNEYGVITLDTNGFESYSSTETFFAEWEGSYNWGNVRAGGVNSQKPESILILYENLHLEEGEIASICKAQACASLPLLLIVEDNDINLEAAIIMLRNEYLLDSARTGEEALKMAEGKLYDAVLMDINLGQGMSGSETAAAIRNLQGYSNVPIAAVTGFELPGKGKRLNFEGCNFYLKKPFNKQQILAFVAEMIAQKKSYG